MRRLRQPPGGPLQHHLVEWALATTGNPNHFPSDIVLGGFLVPVTFVSYLYERLQDWGVTLRPVVLCFLWRGLLGTVVAGTLEYQVALALGFLPKISIGLIEELARLIVPLIFYSLGRYRPEAAWIVLGLISGMGFAAFETMGYGFVSKLAGGPDQPDFADPARARSEPFRDTQQRWCRLRRSGICARFEEVLALGDRTFR